VASEAATAVVRQFQSEIDAIRHADEPLSVRATMFAFVAAVLVGVAILAFARVDRVISSSAGKIVSVDAPFLLQALDPSIVKSIDVRDGEVVEKGRLLARLDPTFAAADVNQFEQQIASLDAQIARDEAELAHSKPAFPPSSDPSRQRYGALQQALFNERDVQYAAQLASFDQKIALAEATIEKFQNDENRYRERLGIAREVEGMRTTLQQHGNESRLNLLGSMDAKIEAVRTMEFDHNSLIEAEHQLDGDKADREAFVQQWFAQTSQDLVTARNNRDAAASQLEKAAKHRDLVRLEAPERAIVLDLAKGVSVGSVLKEGDTLMTLAPMNAPVEAEVDVVTRDVGFVRVGDPVTIKIDAFNFAEHGTVEGVVKWISEDAFTMDDNGVPTPAYYRVRVAITAMKLLDVPSAFRLVPGMTLVGDVKVGTRALGAYLIGGIIHGVGEAMREP
jgi:HlyD family secretion protein